VPEAGVNLKYVILFCAKINDWFQTMKLQKLEAYDSQEGTDFHIMGCVNGYNHWVRLCIPSALSYMH
jgi:hypothetical protein